MKTWNQLNFKKRPFQVKRKWLESLLLEKYQLWSYSSSKILLKYEEKKLSSSIEDASCRNLGNFFVAVEKHVIGIHSKFTKISIDSDL